MQATRRAMGALGGALALCALLGGRAVLAGESPTRIVGVSFEPRTQLPIRGPGLQAMTAHLRQQKGQFAPVAFAIRLVHVQNDRIEIGNQIIRVFQADMQANARAGVRPLAGGAVFSRLLGITRLTYLFLWGLLSTFKARKEVYTIEFKIKYKLYYLRAIKFNFYCGL